MADNTDKSVMEHLRREYDALMDRQQFAAQAPDPRIVERHVEQLTQLARIANSGISLFDMRLRRHVFASYNFAELFGYDMQGIAVEDGEYFASRIHPSDLVQLQRIGVVCLRYFLDHKELAAHAKLINEYRVLVAGRYVRVIEQYQVLEFDEVGNIWLSLSVLDVSPGQASFDGVRSRLLNCRTGEAMQMPGVTQDEPQLSDRETEILRLIGMGRLSKEIADSLAISVHTVNTHRQRILEKLRADNSMEAVRYASARGLLD